MARNVLVQEDLPKHLFVSVCYVKEASSHQRQVPLKHACDSSFTWSAPALVSVNCNVCRPCPAQNILILPLTHCPAMSDCRRIKAR